MSKNPSDLLRSFEDGYYPGSKQKRPQTGIAGAEVDPAGQDLPLASGTVYLLNGRDVELFTIGQLAAVLNRSATTLRRWEADGTLPRSGYTKPSKDPRGRRRLYSRAQIEGIYAIAKDEGVLENGSTLKGTQFANRVLALFQELRKK
jgi:hypothetical protein